MPPAQHRYALTDFQKGKIDALRSYMNYAEIGRELNIPRQTISSFVHRLDERQYSENLSHPGRPRKTSARADRHLIRSALSDTRQPLAELQSINNIEVSERTIHRRLHAAHIQKWRAVNRALLTKKTRQYV